MPEVTPDIPVIKEKSLLNETVQKVAQDIRIMKRKELSAKQEKSESGNKENEQEDNSFVCSFCIQVGMHNYFQFLNFLVTHLCRLLGFPESTSEKQSKIHNKPVAFPI